MKIGFGLILFCLVSQLAIVVIAFDSWHNQIFLPNQMLARYGRAGINALTHGGLWSDMFLLPLLMCFMLIYSGSWNVGRDWLPILLGIVLTVGNQILLSNSARPDPLGSTELKWCLAIAIHAVYMATYIAIIGHFYFNPVNVSPWMVVLASVCVGIHVAAGTHIFLGMIDLVWPVTGCPDVLGDKILPYMNGGVWVLLAALTWFAAGLEAGAWTLGIGAGLAMLVVSFVRLVPPPGA